MNLPTGLRAVRSGRDKAAHYRMWHLRQRAGLSRPDEPSLWGEVAFERALLTLGEESGKMEEVLRLLADYFAAEDRMVLQVLKKAAYPMFTGLAATMIAPLPLLAAGRTGAWLTTTAMGLGLWLAAGGSLLKAVTAHYLNQPAFVLGRLLRALTIAIEAGLTLGRSAELAAQATGNAEVVAHLRRVGGKALTTQPLARTFAGCPFVPATAIAAMEVADASGSYAGTLRKLAELTDELAGEPQ